jgi:hypothetical protein
MKLSVELTTFIVCEGEVGAGLATLLNVRIEKVRAVGAGLTTLRECGGGPAPTDRTTTTSSSTTTVRTPTPQETQ